VESRTREGALEQANQARRGVLARPRPFRVHLQARAEAADLARQQEQLLERWRAQEPRPQARMRRRAPSLGDGISPGGYVCRRRAPSSCDRTSSS